MALFPFPKDWANTLSVRLAVYLLVVLGCFTSSIFVCKIVGFLYLPASIKALFLFSRDFYRYYILDDHEALD